jgi:phage tail sheath protein FI
LAGILSSFASSVQNLFAVISVPYSLTDYSDAIEYIEGITLGSAPKFTVFTHGGLKTVVNGVVTTISEVADVAALIATQYNKAPWLSPSGLENGVINNASGVVVNYGTNSAEEERELITNAGINPVIRRFNAIVNWNAYTMADAANQDKFVSVVALEIYIKRVIMPTVERFLSKPNTPDTWLALYHSVKPFLESLVNKDAFYSYEWNGDQNATSVENLEVNEVTDIQNGNYKAILQAQLVSPIVLITIEFYKKSLSVSL